MEEFTGYSSDTVVDEPHTEHGDSADHTNGAERTERSGRWASRKLRSAARDMPEDRTGRDLLLMVADRIGTLEHQLPHLLSREGLDDLEKQVRDHPFTTVGLAVVAGFLLERTRLVQAVAGGLVSGGGAVAGALFSSDHRNGSPEEEQLLAWLNDAYAMEKAQIPILENHAKDARRHPEIREKDLQHLKETKQHVKDVRRCIEHLGEKPSVTKKVIGRVTGAMESVSTEPFQDEVMKNFIMDYAAEHFEVACYRSLIAAAREAQHPKIARVCEEILEEEEARAEWLQEHLPVAVQITLSS